MTAIAIASALIGFGFAAQANTWRSRRRPTPVYRFLGVDHASPSKLLRDVEDELRRHRSQRRSDLTELGIFTAEEVRKIMRQIKQIQRDSGGRLTI